MSKKNVRKKNKAQLKASNEKVYFPFYITKKDVRSFKFFFLTKKSLNVSEENIIKEDIADAEQSVKKTKTKKRKWWNLVFIILNIGIIAFIFLTQNNGNLVGFGELISSKINFGWLLMAILVVIFAIFTNAFKYYDLIYKATGRRRKYLSYKVVALGRYYDSITPLSTGGQPFQVYYLTKRSIRGELATSIPTVITVFWQISFVFISIVVLTINAFHPITTNPVVITGAWIGLLLNSLVISFVIVFSISKKIGPRITIWIFKLLYKMHIIKNYQNSFRKVVRFVSNYQRSMRYFTSHFKTLVLQLILAIANILCSSLTVFFLYLAFQPNPTLAYWDIFLKMTMCDLATVVMPLPGGAMAAEYSFGALFQSWLPGDVFVWALLFWRTLTYYFYIVQGLLILLYDSIIGNKKARKLDESGYFKSNTILTKDYELDKINDDFLIEKNEVPNEDLERPKEPKLPKKIIRKKVKPILNADFVLSNKKEKLEKPNEKNEEKNIDKK